MQDWMVLVIATKRYGVGTTYIDYPKPVNLEEGD